MRSPITFIYIIVISTYFKSLELIDNHLRYKMLRGNCVHILCAFLGIDTTHRTKQREAEMLKVPS